MIHRETFLDGFSFNFTISDVREFFLCCKFLVMTNWLFVSSTTSNFSWESSHACSLSETHTYDQFDFQIQQCFALRLIHFFYEFRNSILFAIRCISWHHENFTFSISYNLKKSFEKIMNFHNLQTIYASQILLKRLSAIFKQLFLGEKALLMQKIMMCQHMIDSIFVLFRLFCFIDFALSKPIMEFDEDLWMAAKDLKIFSSLLHLFFFFTWLGSRPPFRKKNLVSL